MNSNIRVLWLINHSSARKFEVSILNKIGIHEVYTPKQFPNESNFRSASIDYSLDDNLTISRTELDILNKQNWYQSPSAEAWDIANKHFDVLFFIPYKAEALKSILKNFRGNIILRAYGLVGNVSYSMIIDELLATHKKSLFEAVAGRFWFAEAYQGLHYIENRYLSARSLYLPLGMSSSEVSDSWTGVDKRVFFVCPDIMSNDYYRDIYSKFKKDFAKYDYLIGGSQTISHSDSRVLGYLSAEEHARNMRELRVMFYHSSEPNHVHYHPFEAIRAGMPLVFMANGMLDKLGGRNLPGRCETLQEARVKIDRILSDDMPFIEEVRTSQYKLLSLMKLENCESAWISGFNKLIKALHVQNEKDTARPRYLKKKKKVAVIVPIAYRGGSLRGAKLLAEAILIGSQQADESCEVVFAHPEMDKLDDLHEFDDMPSNILKRSFAWKCLSKEQAERAIHYAGNESWKASSNKYIVPDDNIQSFYDCDLLVIISDRLSEPVLPLKPMVLMVYDYLQRYVSILPNGADYTYLNAAFQSEKILVTTDFTSNDAHQYAGVDFNKVVKLPMLAPDFSLENDSVEPDLNNNYFVWTTNLSPHKNHLNAIKALEIYYNELNGSLDCLITGVDTNKLLKNELPYLKEFKTIVNNDVTLKSRLKLSGELSDKKYRSTLMCSSFLWHAGRIDNGTFSVIEAAYLKVPSLSSDYPAMREINKQFSLSLTWADSDSPQQMALMLKFMEDNALELRDRLPSADLLKKQNVSYLAKHYWGVIRECL
ncbi:glycosyltransferase [Aeromonas veronii]|uniref:glycosyltransferase n=1 Tax=Aeromonas veronii TaxID=654 RepID=UPI003B9E8F88